jgi:FtsZ-binding cell division protein ZapB
VLKDEIKSLKEKNEKIESENEQLKKKYEKLVIENDENRAAIKSPANDIEYKKLLLVKLK